MLVNRKKKVAILGSTGSIGVSALKVIEAFPERFQVTGLSSFSNTKLLRHQIRKFKPLMAAVVEPAAVSGIKREFSQGGINVLSGTEGLEQIAESKDADIIVMAISGFAAIRPLICSVKSGKHICLANKEALVTAGSVVMGLMKKHKALMIPVDSEHSAIFQCIRSGDESRINRLYITGSGGSLHRISSRRFLNLTVKQVLDHPKWKMGQKITVDSATLMNKGLEIIEAHHLFNVPIEKIELLIHPEAVIHSMCEFIDGSVIAQLGVTDMKLPIQYALSYPERLQTPFARFDFASTPDLTFLRPNKAKYPCLSLAIAAAKLSGTAPAVLNAANEIAVKAFLRRNIRFTKIPDIIESVLKEHSYIEAPSLSEIYQADEWARQKAGILTGNRTKRAVL